MSVGDFIAMQDVLNELAEDSDSLSADEAIAALEALGELASVLKRTTSMVETALRQQLEGVEGRTRVLAGRAYSLAPKGKWRYRHREILHRIADHAAMPNADGEVPTAREAAIIAARLTQGIYASDSTVPKTTGLRALGFTPPAPRTATDVADWQKTGTQVVVTDLNAPEGA